MRNGTLGVIFFFIIRLFGFPSTAQAQSAVTVIDDGFRFSPDPVYIVVGQTVEWFDDGSGPYYITGPWGSQFTPCAVQFLAVGSYDYSDDVADFGTVIVSANIPPSVTITNPANNSVFTAPVSFSLAADASDTDPDGLSDVEFYVGTNLVDDVFSSPFATDVTNLVAGTYTLTAIAYDNGGATATNAITITVQNPVAIQLTALNLAAGQFRFGATGLTLGKTNILQSSTNLGRAAVWIPIRTNVASSSSASFTNAISGPRRYFRLLQMP